MKRFLSLFLGIAMMAGHFAVPVYAEEVPAETAYVEDTAIAEDNIVETFETEESETIIADTESLESEAIFESEIPEQILEETTETYLGLQEEESEETETESEEELEKIDSFSLVYVNPLYADVVSETDLLSGISDEYKVSFLEDVEYLTTEAEVISYIRSSMEYRVNDITVYYATTEEFNQSVLDRWMIDVYAETGVSTQGDYLRLHFGGLGGGASGMTDGTTYYYTINLNASYYTTYDQEEAVGSAITNALYGFGFDSNTTDYQKIKTIYDWVCSNVTYDHDNLNDSSYLLKYTAYAAIINGTSVCQGYSSLMYRFLREAGISVRCITGIGNGGAHAWNIVQIGDYYYNMDATWDAGYSVYHYFLKSDENFVDHARDAQYTTDTFYSVYPMTSEDYVADMVIREADVTLEYTEIEFAAAELKPEVTVTKNGQTLTPDLDYTVVYYNNYNAGQARVVIEGIGDYSGEITKYFTITKHILARSEISLEFDTAEYTGSAIKPKVTIKYNGKVFVDNSDNWGGIYYQKNINIGTAEVLIETERISSNFEIGVQILNFEIVPIDITKAQVKLENTSFTYTGTQIKPSVTEVYLKGKGGYLEEGTEYKVRYDENLNNGTGYVYIDGVGNYGGTLELPITIQRVGIYNASLSVDVDATELIYNGQAHTPPYTITYNDIPLVEGVDYNAAYYNNVNASGSAYVEVEGIGNFHSTTSRMFRINQASLKNAEVTLDKTVYLYTGEMIAPKPVVKYGDNILVEDKDYTLGYNNNIEIGSATVTVKGTGNYTSNVALTYEIVEGYPINDAEISMEESFEYTGSPIVPDITVIYNGQNLEKDVDYEVVYSNNTSVGTAAVTINGLGDYIGTVEKTFEITGKLIEDEDITLEYTSHTVTGRDLHPGVIVVVDGNILVKDTDYTLTYENCRYITDIPKITITGIGNWSGTVEKTFTITRVPIDQIEVTFDKEGYEYTGNPIYPKVTLKYENITTIISAGSDHALVEYSNNINVSTEENGRASLWFNPGELNPNFESGGMSLLFDIVGKNIDKSTTVTLSSTYFTYTGSAIEPKVSSVVRGSLTLVEGKDYTVRYENNINAGTGNVHIDGIGIYAGTITKTFTIAKAQISKANIVIDASNCIFNGEKQIPVYTLTFNDIELVDGVDYIPSFENNIDAGTATISFMGFKNFQSTTSKNFDIKAASINDAELILPQNEYLYTGSEITPEPTVVVEERTLVKDTDYTLSYSDNENVGTASITIEGVGNYRDEKTVTFEIVNRSISSDNIVVTMEDSFDFTSKAIEPELTIKDGDYSLILNKDYTVSYSDNINAGTGKVYIEGIGNYAGTIEKNFVINPANINKALGYIGKCVYNGNEQKPTYRFEFGDYTLIEGVDYDVTFEKNINVGYGVLYAKAKGNFAGTYLGTFRIDAAPISDAEVTFPQDKYIYTGGAITPEPTVVVDGRTLIKDTDYTLTYYSNNVNPGTATMKIQGVGNYNTGGIDSWIIVTFEIVKADQNLMVSIDKNNIEIDETGKITVTGLGTISYTSSNNEIATVDSNGVVKGVKEGSVVITVTADGNDNYNSASKTIDVTIVHTKHSYDNGVVTVEPKCDEVGIRLYTCSECGDTKTEDVAVLGHSYSELYTVDKEASCKEAGSKSRHCINEGCDSKTDVTEIAKLDHNYDDGIITVEPNCEDVGTKLYTCSECGETKTEDVAVLGHSYSELYTVDKEASCKEAGSKSRHCINKGCDSKTDVTEIAKTDHNYDNGKVTTQPTGEKEGVKTYTCSACGDTKTESIPKLTQYKVTFNANGGSKAPNAQMVTEGHKLTLPKDVPVRDGYTFEGWYTAKSGGSKVLSGAVITKNITVYAHWKQTYTGVEAFVARLYNVCLNRNPDAGGLADWSNKLTTKQIDGVTAAHGFVFSAEFINKNLCNEDYVKQLYKAFLGREADAGGLKDWASQLESGVTREAVFNGFALSVEFGNLCNSYGITQGNGITVPQYGTQPSGSCAICGKEDGVTGFVKRLYRVCLNREADAGGLADWTGQLRNHTNTGRGVAYGFIFSQEFINKKYNNADYVEQLYLAFMGRGSDAGGKADWLNRMEKQGWTREQVFDGFVGSQEFTNICNSYGITRD